MWVIALVFEDVKAKDYSEAATLAGFITDYVKRQKVLQHKRVLMSLSEVPDNAVMQPIQIIEAK